MREKIYNLQSIRVRFAIDPCTMQSIRVRIAIIPCLKQNTAEQFMAQSRMNNNFYF